MKHWDPYPFVLMNLFLSLQAAYTAPLIMMAQNREVEKDRHHPLRGYPLHEDFETRGARAMSERVVGAGPRGARPMKSGSS
jgi:uncharacterized membrane protein